MGKYDEELERDKKKFDALARGIMENESIPAELDILEEEKKQTSNGYDRLHNPQVHVDENGIEWEW